MSFSESLIIELDKVDSTNNYAMQLIDANKAQHGLTIVAKSQSGGKGQRGRTWADQPGQSLLMSIVITPRQAISAQFTFNALVTVTIVTTLQDLFQNLQFQIKWPNDIIINDKKAGGILIENVLRGSQWLYSVVGFGLNVLQDSFPADLPNATSLKMASGSEVPIDIIRDYLRNRITDVTRQNVAAEPIMIQYNEYLYKRGQKQSFSANGNQWLATIINTRTDGALEVQLEDGTITTYYHGQVMWDWQ